MSKSLGNLVFISELVKEWDPMAVRLAILDHPYRHAWDWTEDLLPAAVERLDRWRAAAVGAGGGGALDDVRAALDDVRAALDDDLDFPRAIAAIDAAVAQRESAGPAAALLGVTL
jgi:L-cysteine:1D-myo-inositol 2-amino-2-deoxy-alpha-D-glucopyranoside ligase